MHTGTQQQETKSATADGCESPWYPMKGWDPVILVPVYQVAWVKALFSPHFIYLHYVNCCDKKTIKKNLRKILSNHSVSNKTGLVRNAWTSV